MSLNSPYSYELLTFVCILMNITQVAYQQNKLFDKFLDGKTPYVESKKFVTKRTITINEVENG